MADTSRNFTSLSSEEIMSELKKAGELHLRFKRLKSQLKLCSYCPGFMLWTKDRRELRGEELIRYLKRELIALTQELGGGVF